MFINLFHIFVIAPFFYYIATQKDKVDPRVYDVLLWSAGLIVLYHGFKAYRRYQLSQSLENVDKKQGTNKIA